MCWECVRICCAKTVPATWLDAGVRMNHARSAILPWQHTKRSSEERKIRKAASMGDRGGGREGKMKGGVKKQGAVLDLAREVNNRRGEHLVSPSSSICSEATRQNIHAICGTDLWICIIAVSPPHCVISLAREEDIIQAAVGYQQTNGQNSSPVPSNGHKSS